MFEETGNEEERGSSEGRESQEFYGESHKKMQSQEIRVFSGGDGTFLNKAMFDYFQLDNEADYAEKEKKLREQLREGNLAEEKKRELYDAVKAKVDGSLKAGNLKDVDPVPHDSDENSVSYKVDGHNLDQKDIGDGMFKFSPEGKFTGVLRVERKGPDGELLSDSVDIIEYKNGKPVSVIPGPEGDTRVADFGLISQQAGISVSKFQDTGISVSRVKEESPSQQASKGVNPTTAAQSGPKAIKDSPSKSGPIVKTGQDIDTESLKFIANIIKERVKFDDLPREKQLAMNETFVAINKAIKEGKIKIPKDDLAKEITQEKGRLLDLKDSQDKSEPKELPEHQKKVVAALMISTLLLVKEAEEKKLLGGKSLKRANDVLNVLRRAMPGMFKKISGLEKFVGESISGNSNIVPANSRKVKSMGKGGQGR